METLWHFLLLLVTVTARRQQQQHTISLNIGGRLLGNNIGVGHTQAAQLSLNLKDPVAAPTNTLALPPSPAGYLQATAPAAPTSTPLVIQNTKHHDHGSHLLHHSGPLLTPLSFHHGTQASSAQSLGGGGDGYDSALLGAIPSSPSYAYPVPAQPFHHGTQDPTMSLGKGGDDGYNTAVVLPLNTVTSSPSYAYPAPALPFHHGTLAPQVNANTGDDVIHAIVNPQTAVTSSPSYAYPAPALPFQHGTLAPQQLNLNIGVHDDSTHALVDASNPGTSSPSYHYPAPTQPFQHGTHAPKVNLVDTDDTQAAVIYPLDIATSTPSYAYPAPSQSFHHGAQPSTTLDDNDDQDHVSLSSPGYRVSSPTYSYPAPAKPFLHQQKQQVLTLTADDASDKAYGTTAISPTPAYTRHPLHVAPQQQGGQHQLKGQHSVHNTQQQQQQQQGHGSSLSQAASLGNHGDGGVLAVQVGREGTTKPQHTYDYPEPSVGLPLPTTAPHHQSLPAGVSVSPVLDLRHAVQIDKSDLNSASLKNTLSSILSGLTDGAITSLEEVKLPGPDFTAIKRVNFFTATAPSPQKKGSVSPKRLTTKKPLVLHPRQQVHTFIAVAPSGYSLPTPNQHHNTQSQSLPIPDQRPPTHSQALLTTHQQPDTNLPTPSQGTAPQGLSLTVKGQSGLSSPLAGDVPPSPANNAQNPGNPQDSTAPKDTPAGSVPATPTHTSGVGEASGVGVPKTGTPTSPAGPQTSDQSITAQVAGTPSIPGSHEPQGKGTGGSQAPTSPVGATK